jgi:hypothetical protein
MAHQILDRGGATRVGAYADAGADLEGGARGHLEGLAQAIDDTCREVGREVGDIDHHQEFVAARAAQEIAVADDRSQPLSDRLQQRAADQVPVGLT